MQKLPNAQSAIIELAKLRDYRLSAEHTRGGLILKSGGTSDNMIATGGLYDDQTEARIYDRV
jgi:hypothetical protein